MIEGETPTPRNCASGAPEARPKPGCSIRSYTLRQGRLTSGQRDALETLWPVFGLSPDRTLDATVCGRDAPLVVEIGFGNGESLARMAAAQPDTDFIGIEVHRPGVGHLLLQLRDRGLQNVRIYCADAVEILARNVADGNLAGINLFFPDPWPKQRHHKRRLVTADFLSLVATKLQRGGFFHAATDWPDYARQMTEVLEACPDLMRATTENPDSLRPASRPPTRFEARGQRLGHEIRDLVYIRR